MANQIGIPDPGPWGIIAGEDDPEAIFTLLGRTEAQAICAAQLTVDDPADITTLAEACDALGAQRVPITNRGFVAQGKARTEALKER